MMITSMSQAILRSLSIVYEVSIMATGTLNSAELKGSISINEQYDPTLSFRRGGIDVSGG